MNIIVKSVTSPFSFFCVTDDDNKITKDQLALESSKTDKIDLKDTSHGQYVAVLWKDRWARGIVSMESNFLIWLVDNGTYIRPTEDTVYVPLPVEYKKLPSKVFEASIHGVTPMGLELDDLLRLERKATLSWSVAAIAQTQELIDKASCTYFMPIAMMSTKINDVVLGDLYLKFEGKRFFNLIDVMSSQADDAIHVLMERDKEAYINNLSTFYSNRRLHRACLLKPELPIKNLPYMTTATSLVKYNAICDTVERFDTQESDISSEDGSSVTYIENVNDIPNKKLKLTPSEIEKYSNEYIIVAGREYNVLTVLINKARDLYICEKYKDAKSVGRATTRLRK